MSPREHKLQRRGAVTMLSSCAAVGLLLWANPCAGYLQQTHQSALPNGAERQTPVVPAHTRPVVVNVLTISSWPATGATAQIEAEGVPPTVLSAAVDERGMAWFDVPISATSLVVFGYRHQQSSVPLCTNVPADARSPLYLFVNLWNPCRPLTVHVERVSHEPLHDVVARIEAERDKDRGAVRGAVATVCNDNRIVFPSVYVNVRDVRVSVTADGVPKRYSQPFRINGTRPDPLVVNLNPSPTLRGAVRWCDETPLDRCTLFALPLRAIGGHGTLLQHSIAPDRNGRFEDGGFEQGLYEVEIRHAKAIPCNTCLYFSAGGVSAEFTLKPRQMCTVSGTVYARDTHEVVPNVTLDLCVTDSRPFQQQNLQATTDARGQFVLRDFPVGDGRPPRINAAGPWLLHSWQLTAVTDTSLVYRCEVQRHATLIVIPDSPEPLSMTESGLHCFLLEPEHARQGAGALPAQLVMSMPRMRENTFVFERLPAPQAYAVRLSSREWYTAANFPLINVAPDGCTTCTVTLTPVPQVLVTAIDRNGMPVTNCSLEVRVGYSNWFSPYPRVPCLSPGRYCLRVPPTMTAGTMLELTMRGPAAACGITNIVPYVDPTGSTIAIVLDQRLPDKQRASAQAARGGLVQGGMSGTNVFARQFPGVNAGATLPGRRWPVISGRVCIGTAAHPAPAYTVQYGAFSINANGMLDSSRFVMELRDGMPLQATLRVSSPGVADRHLAVDMRAGVSRDLGDIVLPCVPAGDDAARGR